jgi:hypothetical protein
VLLNVSDEASLKEKIIPWKADRILVQRMESGLAEAIVGYRDDPVAGPIVLVGAGGVLSEIYRDVAVRAAPVSESEAQEMIAQVKGLAVVRGYRNLPRGDLEALAHAVAAFSQNAFHTNVSQAEINPLIIKAQGVVAVDALLVLKEKD